jgi:hypothetical protein
VHCLILFELIGVKIMNNRNKSFLSIDTAAEFSVTFGAASTLALTGALIGACAPVIAPLAAVAGGVAGLYIGADFINGNKAYRNKIRNLEQIKEEPEMIEKNNDYQSFDDLSAYFENLNPERGLEREYKEQLYLHHKFDKDNIPLEIGNERSFEPDERDREVEDQTIYPALFGTPQRQRNDDRNNQAANADDRRFHVRL